MVVESWGSRKSFGSGNGSLNIDHEVKSVKKMRGGRFEALKRMEVFLEFNLKRYSTDRNNTENPAVSTLSPWFHFGHISTIEVVVELLKEVIGLMI